MHATVDGLMKRIFLSLATIVFSTRRVQLEMENEMETNYAQFITEISARDDLMFISWANALRSRSGGRGRQSRHRGFNDYIGLMEP